MKVELIYFDLQGRATQTRIMLKMAGIEFTDTRLSKEEFLEKKASFEESALGQLPILKVNDKVRDSYVSDSKPFNSGRQLTRRGQVYLVVQTVSESVKSILSK